MGSEEFEIQETGIEAFDRILNGGIPRGHVMMVSGDSGTGKTILGMEWLFRGYKNYDENGLYLTLTEPITQALKNVKTLSFYDEEAFNSKDIHFTDLRTTIDLLDMEGGGDIDKDDIEALLDAIEEIVTEIDADRVVIDSITAIAYMLEKKALIRYFIFRLGAVLDNLDVTTYLTSEVSDDSYSVFGVEEFISDAIIMLRQEELSDDLQRTLQVVKMRGIEFESNEFTFTLTEDGVNIFYLEPDMTYASPDERVSTGVPGIDEMCDGGIFKSSISMVSGPAGTGKTLLSLHFVLEALHNEGNAVFVTFEEGEQQLVRNARHFGWDLEQYIEDGSLTIHSQYPESLFPEEHLDQLKRTIEVQDVQRVVLDPLSAIGNTYPQEDYVTFARKAVGYLKNRQVTGLVTSSTPNLMGSQSLSESNLSTLTDNVFLLKYAETEGQLSRVISVLKTRGTRHDEYLHQYQIASSTGIHIGGPVSAFEGVFSGTARKVQKTVKEQMRSLFVDALGPMGETEFEELADQGISQGSVKQYIDRLEQDGVLTADEATDFREEALDLLSND